MKKKLYKGSELKPGKIYQIYHKDKSFISSYVVWPGNYKMDEYNHTLPDLNSNQPILIISNQHITIGAGGQPIDYWFFKFLYRGGYGSPSAGLASQLFEEIK